VVQFEIWALSFWQADCAIILTMKPRRPTIKDSTTSLRKAGSKKSKQVADRAARKAAAKKAKQQAEDVNQSAARIVREATHD